MVINNHIIIYAILKTLTEILGNRLFDGFYLRRIYLSLFICNFDPSKMIF